MSACKLLSFHILERVSGNNVITWTYPTIARENEAHLLQNSNKFCTRKTNVWFYSVGNGKHTISILSAEFKPGKYKYLCEIFLETLRENGNPVELVKLFITHFTSSKHSFHENGTYAITKAVIDFEGSTDIKGFIRSFNLETVLLYVAVLLKRRIIFYSSSPELLYDELFALSTLVPCRSPEEYLYPFVENLRELKSKSFYAVGTTSPTAKKDETSYDLFVDLQSREIHISSKSQEIIAMARTQKELAVFLLNLAEGNSTEEQVQNELIKKNQDLIKSLDKFTSANNTDRIITVDDLKSRRLSAGLENFIFNLAVAENMIML